MFGGDFFFFLGVGGGGGVDRCNVRRLLPCYLVKQEKGHALLLGISSSSSNCGFKMLLNEPSLIALLEPQRQRLLRRGCDQARPGWKHSCTAFLSCHAPNPSGGL